MNDNRILISKEAAEKHGIQLDASGWPTTESLNAWHAKNNPQPKHKHAMQYILASAIGIAAGAWLIIQLLP